MLNNCNAVERAVQSAILFPARGQAALRANQEADGQWRRRGVLSSMALLLAALWLGGANDVLAQTAPTSQNGTVENRPLPAWAAQVLQPTANQSAPPAAAAPQPAAATEPAATPQPAPSTAPAAAAPQPTAATGAAAVPQPAPAVAPTAAAPQPAAVTEPAAVPSSAPVPVSADALRAPPGAAPAATATPAAPAQAEAKAAAPSAAPAVPTAVPTAMEIAFGQYLSYDCLGCHRMEGAANGAPSLDGRPREQILELLGTFRSGKRRHAIMTIVAGSLAEDEVQALAAYFSSQPKRK